MKEWQQTEECNDTGIRWISGNIRRKLTLFVVLILIMVIGMFWFFSVVLLPLAYQNSIRTELMAALNTVANVMNDVAADGGDVVVTEPVQGEGSLVLVRLSDDVIARMNEALSSGALNLNNRCLDISDKTLQNLLLVDNLEPLCGLHPSHETGITADGAASYAPERNGGEITRLRQQVFADGSVYSTANSQITIGLTTADGSLAVIVTVNQERIPQAVSVLQRLLLPLSLLLGLFSITAGWGFSRWFTRPLSRLSAAAKEMAKGNYDVRVADCGDDEIGDLARDFNTMAQEVGRSASLQRDILANVSHDLRTPLTLIKGYAETVRDLTGDDPEKRTEQLNVIVDETDRLSKLVGSVMELSRMSSGIERPEPVHFDLTQLCDEVADRYEAVCAQNGYNFVFDGEDGCMVFADPKLLERVLHNLLGNAMSHVGEDGYIGLSVHKTGKDTVRCSVSDHGPGISPQDMPRLFDRYYRSRTDAGKAGTGLGLSIVKAILVACGLDYGVESMLGQGSTFWFEAKLDDTIEN